MVLRVQVMRVLQSAGHRVDENVRVCARDAAHALDEVQGDALGHQDRPRAGPEMRAMTSPGATWVASGILMSKAMRGIDQA